MPPPAVAPIGVTVYAANLAQHYGCTVTNGALTLSGTAGLTLMAGANGSSTMTYQGTIANRNAVSSPWVNQVDLSFRQELPGFAEVETRFLNAPEPVDGIDPRLNEILFAPLDYAIVARR